MDTGAVGVPEPTLGRSAIMTNRAFRVATATRSSARRRSRCRRSSSRDDDGAVLVEAAIVMPLLLLIVFGILEYGLVFRTTLSISESTRAGARVAVAQPRVEGYEDSAAAAVSGALASAGIPADDIEELVIYKADPNTGQTVAGGAPQDCTADCWKFVWSEGDQRFDLAPSSPTWEASSQFACGSQDQTDFVGVYVRANYTFVTGFFGESMTMQERSVMRLEPLPLSDTCAPA
ncbi:MAG: TadE family protein [Acidimicrobiales bacterium]